MHWESLSNWKEIKSEEDKIKKHQGAGYVNVYKLVAVCLFLIR